MSAPASRASALAETSRLRPLFLPVATSVDPCTPLDALLYRCVLQPLHEQVELVDRAGAALFLYGPVRLLEHLQAIRKIVLLESVQLGMGANQGLVHDVHTLLHPPWPLNEVFTDEVAHRYAIGSMCLGEEMCDGAWCVLCVYLPTDDHLSTSSSCRGPDSYLRVHEALTRFQQAASALQACWINTKVAARGPKALPRAASLFLYDVSHFVNTMHAYINLQVRLSGHCCHPCPHALPFLLHSRNSTQEAPLPRVLLSGPRFVPLLSSLCCCRSGRCAGTILWTD